MAAVTLTNPVITVNSVDLTDQCQSITLDLGEDALESTAFGDTGHVFSGGLQTVNVQATFYLDYGTGSTEATLQAIIGTTTTLTVQAQPGATSTSNPEYTITGTFLSTFTPINGSYGTLSTVDCTWQGGTWTRATT